MARLDDIGPETWREVTRLAVTPARRGFVADGTTCLARAYRAEDGRARAIVADSQVVGVVVNLTWGTDSMLDELLVNADMLAPLTRRAFERAPEHDAGDELALVRPAR